MRPVKRGLRRLLRQDLPASRANRPAPAIPERWPGEVQEIGKKAILGTVDVVGGSEPVRVTLAVDDVEVDHVDVPPNDDGGAARFRFPVKDMWTYCSPDRRVTVRVGGEPLRMPDGGTHHAPASTGEKPLSELKKRLKAGEIVSSSGALALPKYLDEEWQRTATDVYRQVHDAVQELTGYEPFLIYGSLLGAVREGRPLGHDLDLDCAYLSKETDPAMVLKEVGQLALALQERGFAVEAMTTCMHISDPDRRQRIDLYHTFFNDDDELRLAWGAVSDVPFMRSQWQGTEHVSFGGAEVLVPRNAESLVATLYGPNWRTPNPGFDWKAERTTRAEEAFFPAKLRPGINWQNYWSRVTFDSPTSFAGMVLRLPTRYQYVVDLGCGDGRDAPLFVRSGARVLGLDYAKAAIESAKGRRLPEDLAEFSHRDLSAPGALRESLGSGERSRTLFYGRQLLDSVNKSTTATILEQVIDLMAPGDAVALEFRGPSDDTLWDHEKRNWGRRVVDPAPVRDQLAAAGLEIEIDAGGRRWEQRGDKAIRLHRLVARKP